MITVIIISFILCVILSGFCSSSEIAYSSVNHVRLENLSKKGNKKAKTALRISENFDRLLSTILVCNNLVNIASSSLGSVLFTLLFNTTSLNWLSTLSVTIIVIIFGETVPKIIAKKTATVKALNNAWLLNILSVVFLPIVSFTVLIVNMISKLFKVEETEESDDESVEELQAIIETAENEGIIDADDSEIMQNAIEFPEIMASEVMTARIDITAIDADDSWDDILDSILKSPFSRIPVYRDSIDNIIGILHLNRFFTELAKNGNNSFDIVSILNPTCYVYKTIKLPSVLNEFRKSRQHLAVVTDEYSGTLGIVTLEDVMEHIVGDIWDETDTVENEIVENKNNYELDGDLTISDFIDLFDLDEDSLNAESETVGGLVIEKLNHFPTVGEKVSVNNLIITVQEMDGLRVSKIKVERE